MGLVRKAPAEDVVPGEGGGLDISMMVRNAVAAEIERQRLETLERDKKQEPDPSDEDQ